MRKMKRSCTEAYRTPTLITVQFKIYDKSFPFDLYTKKIIQKQSDSELSVFAKLCQQLFFKA